MQIVTLSRQDGSLVAVNVAQVAYFATGPEGTTRIVFASGGNGHSRENALAEDLPGALTLEVAESFDDVILAFTSP